MTASGDAAQQAGRVSPEPAAGIVGGLRSRWRVLVKEVGAFGFVGAVCFLIELGLFQLLYAELGFGAVTARLISTLLSMTVAYVAHRYWSFSHRARSSVRREYSIFFLVNGCTLLLGLAVVWFVRHPLGQESVLVLQAANVASTALGTLIRFLAYRRWVFRDPALHGAPAQEAPLAPVEVPGDRGCARGPA